jgi:hypothetical protein
MIINNPIEKLIIVFCFSIYLLPPIVIILAVSENGARTLRFRIIENPITSISMTN